MHPALYYYYFVSPSFFTFASFPGQESSLHAKSENGKQEEGSNVGLKRIHIKNRKTWVGAVEVMNPLHTNIALLKTPAPVNKVTKPSSQPNRLNRVVIHGRN